MISSTEAETSGIYTYNGVSSGAGNEVIVDSQVVLPDEIWLVDSCSMIGIDLTLHNGLFFPGGIYLCPPGTTTPSAVLVSNSIGAAIAVQALIALPITPFSQDFLTGGGEVVGCNVTKTFAIPPGGFVRAVFDGGDNTDPSANSSLQLFLTAVRRKVCS